MKQYYLCRLEGDESNPSPEECSMIARSMVEGGHIEALVEWIVDSERFHDLSMKCILTTNQLGRSLIWLCVLHRRLDLLIQICNSKL